MLPAQPNQSLIDGLACLQALAGRREPIGSRELARLLGLEPTRVNRLLKTLAYLGLAEQDAKRRYRPGPAIHVLAARSLFGSGLLQRAMDPLESLHRFGHIVALGVLWRDQVCYLYHAGPGTSIAHGLGHHRIYPAASSGLGMALLAHRPESEIRELYAKPGVHSSPLAAADLPVPDADTLLRELEEVRRKGYALVRVPETQSRTLGISVGTPPYAAIGLSGKFDDTEVDTLVTALREVSHLIEDRNEEKS